MFSRAHSHSIGRQFIILIAGIITLALITSSFFQYHNQKSIAHNKLVEKGNSIGNLLSSISIEPLLIYDNHMLNELAQNTTDQNEVVYTIFVDNEKNTLSNYINNHDSFVRKIINSQPDISNSVFNTYVELKKEDHILHLSFPIMFDGRQLAEIKIGFDKRPILTEPLNNLVIHLGSSLIFGIFIGSSIYIGFRRKISSPINKLISSANEIAKFDFEHTISIKGDNEISSLANALNSMRLTLKDAVESKDNTLREVEELNASLEVRVEERTNSLQELNTQITHQAMHDPLTGLPNRSLIIERLNNAIDYAKRKKTKLAVFILDLNNFKEINDTLGHPEGDLVLKQVADRIPSVLRASDTVGRLGGDEFAIVLPEVDTEHAIDVGNKIVGVMQAAFNLSNQTVNIGTSIGIALFPDHGEDQSELIRHADVAMYHSKRNNHHVTVYHTDYDTHTPWRLALMADLKEAIENNSLELHYQPQTNLASNKTYSVEALLRWNHHEQGYIAPDQFIYIAENSGLIKELTDWVLNCAFAQWKEWNNDGLSVNVSINISARNLADPLLPNTLERLAKLHGMPYKYITLELTESTIMTNPDQALKLMNNEKLSEIHYSIDDFGTGYSSLSYLKKLPVHEVKIDKSFIFDMDTNPDDASIVNSIIQLSQNLGYSVVAEGVETQKSLDTLSQLGCDFAQGYFISRPIPSSEIVDKLSKLNS